MQTRGWALSSGHLAPEYITAGELVIEYCGEVVRRPVADKRERQYAAAGGAGSCFMFALDAVRPRPMWLPTENFEWQVCQAVYDVRWGHSNASRNSIACRIVMLSSPFDSQMTA